MVKSEESAEAKKVMLAKKWDEDKTNPRGWWISEKLDGVRAFFDGKIFYSRQGKKYWAPQWYTKELQELGVALDGELWCGRGFFQKCVSVVRNQSGMSDWSQIRYLVFDAPKFAGGYEKRVQYLNQLPLPDFVKVVGIQRCEGRSHLKRLLAEVEKDGGEGLMIREPRSTYDWKRSSALLKVKSFQDEEAKVVGHKSGKGRLTGMCGGIECVLVNGKRFTVGTGFDDSQRKNPPPLNSVVTVKYQELSDGGIPRFPVFLRIRSDVTWDEVKENAKTKIPFSQIKKVKSTEEQRYSLLWTEVGGKLPSRKGMGNLMEVAKQAKKRKVGTLDLKPAPIEKRPRAEKTVKSKPLGAPKNTARKMCSLFAKQPTNQKKPSSISSSAIPKRQKIASMFAPKPKPPSSHLGRPKTTGVRNRPLVLSSDDDSSDDEQPLSSLFKRKTATQAWNCSACTFRNPIGGSPTTCSMCGTTNRNAIY